MDEYRAIAANFSPAVAASFSLAIAANPPPAVPANFSPAIPAFSPVIPAKAGIQTVAIKPAT